MSYVLVLGYVNALHNGGNGLAHFLPKIPKRTLGVPRPLQGIYNICSIMTMQTTPIVLKSLWYYVSSPSKGALSFMLL